MRDFNPARVGFGSNSTELAQARISFLYAMPPIATDPVCHIEVSEVPSAGRSSRKSPSCSRANIHRDGIADRAVQHHRRRTRRSSSASDLTRCSRSRMACPETDWVGKSRRGPGPFDSSTG